MEYEKKDSPDIPEKIESNILQLNWAPGGEGQEIKITPNVPCSKISFWFEHWKNLSDFYFYDGEKLLAEVSYRDSDLNNIEYTNNRITHFTFTNLTDGLNMDTFKFTQ